MHEKPGLISPSNLPPPAWLALAWVLIFTLCVGLDYALYKMVYFFYSNLGRW